MDVELNWPLSSIVYHIYVRSFNDSNNDGIGDLPGLIQKVEYLRELGITAVWLSPIYPSPQADFGYDVSNYKDIDPIFGTLEDFNELVTQLHKNNIKLMMDFVPNHTSSKHPWFVESRSNKSNPKRDWYIWHDPKPDGSPPNNWLSNFGGAGWTLDPTTNQYYLHSFDKEQPDLNWRNPEVVKEMLDSLRFWLDRGVDGFRVDAVYHLFKDKQFRDEPPNPNFLEGRHGIYDSLLHVNTFALPETLSMIKRFIDILKEYKNKFMVTEAYTTLPELIKMYTTIDWEFYAPFNFSLITMPWKAQIHKEYIDEYDKALGDVYIPCYVLGNHDQHRVATRIGTEQAKVAAMMLLSLRGLPFVYYGEEIGMEDAVIPKEKIVDTYEINSPGLGLGRDPQRTPMQWDDSKNAGFSTANETWLPVAENYKEVNVKKELHDPKSFFNYYKKLIHLRKTNKALKEGTYTALPSPAEDVFAFIRELEHNKVLVILNMSIAEKKISFAFKNTTVLCDTNMEKEEKQIDLSDYTLEKNEGIIVSL
jgi:alpha-glucosidase